MLLKLIALIFAMHEMLVDAPDHFYDIYFTKSINITIEFNLNNMQNLLSYNDLVIRLNNEEIGFNEVAVNIKNLCRCGTTDCLYEKLNFNFTFAYNVVRVTCNSGEHKNINVVYNDNLLKNKIFVIKSIPAIRPGGNFIYVHSVSPPLSYKPQNWTRKCKNTTCNGGLCHDVFPSYFLCDCTKTVQNGPFCNESLYLHKNDIDSSFLMELWQLKIAHRGTPLHAVFYGEKHTIDIAQFDFNLTVIIRTNATKYRIDTSYDIMGNFNSSAFYVILLMFRNPSIGVSTFNSANDKWTEISLHVCHPVASLPTRLNRMVIKGGGSTAVAWKISEIHTLHGVNLSNLTQIATIAESEGTTNSYGNVTLINNSKISTTIIPERGKNEGKKKEDDIRCITCPNSVFPKFVIAILSMIIVVQQIVIIWFYKEKIQKLYHRVRNGKDISPMKENGTNTSSNVPTVDQADESRQPLCGNSETPITFEMISSSPMARQASVEINDSDGSRQFV